MHPRFWLAVYAAGDWVAAAENTKTPAHVLEWLADHGDSGVRYSVAWNQATSPGTLTKLTRDVDIDVREIALSNLKFRS